MPESPQTPPPVLLSQLKVQIKDILIVDLEKALLTLKQQLWPESKAYDEIIIALERCNRIEKALQKGLLPFREADLLFNQIVNSCIFTINNLKEQDLAGNV